jgi:hypothetical protein
MRKEEEFSNGQWKDNHVETLFEENRRVKGPGSLVKRVGFGRFRDDHWQYTLLRAYLGRGRM